MDDEPLTPEQRLEVTYRVFTDAVGYMAKMIDELNGNLTATQDRCSALLNENRDLKKQLKELRVVLDLVEQAAKAR